MGRGNLCPVSWETKAYHTSIERTFALIRGLEAVAGARP